ncbi:MAG: hypothetical protein B9S32_16375 [Verrucomicrobia bacterium Tous-C9LFEB]|nr:MAG: hypothetical protein B9S32_16375 [Verrucomicrobia bacterium Tous-C9LFEB]
MKGTLSGRVALVTGAGSGIGKASAKALAYAGASVAVISRTREEVEITSMEICSGGGSIIVTASVNGNRIFSNTGATAYSCSKAGQVAMTKMLAVELAKYRIRVNAICPGAIGTLIDDNTEQRNLVTESISVEYPEGPIPLTGNTPGAAGQVAELAWFLASDASNHITGTKIYIDGGQSLLQG